MFLGVHASRFALNHHNRSILYHSIICLLFAHYLYLFFYSLFRHAFNSYFSCEGASINKVNDGSACVAIFLIPSFIRVLVIHGKTKSVSKPGMIYSVGHMKTLNRILEVCDDGGFLN